MPPFELPFTFRTPPDLLARLDRIDRRLEDLMALGADLKAELVKANTTTNEIAADLDDLIAKLAQSTDPAVQEALDELRAFNSRLTDVAAKHTPEP